MDAHGTFHDLVGELDYPMFIVTVRAGDQQAGCLVGFATQSSRDSPRFLVCLSRLNRTYRVAQQADLLTVHLIPCQAQALAELFGDHVGHQLEPIEARHDGDGSFLDFHRAKRIQPGHPV